MVAYAILVIAFYNHVNSKISSHMIELPTLSRFDLLIYNFHTSRLPMPSMGVQLMSYNIHTTKSLVTFISLLVLVTCVLLLTLRLNNTCLFEGEGNIRTGFKEADLRALNGMVHCTGIRTSSYYDQISNLINI